MQKGVLPSVEDGRRAVGGTDPHAVRTREDIFGAGKGTGWMKTLLVLGATPFQIPIVRKAHERGHRVITIDNVPGNPAHSLADESADISTTDREAVCRFARDRRVDGIMTGASDVAVTTVGFVADSLGLPGITYEQGLTLTRKDLFRSLQREAGLRHPEFFVCDEWAQCRKVAQDLDGIYILKPVDRSGSAGTAIVHVSGPARWKDIRSCFEAAREASLKGKVILEAVIQGVEQSGDLFLRDGRIISLHLTNKNLTPGRHPVPRGHTIPSRLESVVQEGVRRGLLEVVTRLGVKDGPMNFDVIVDPGGASTILEMSPRFGGNCIPQVIEYGAGFDEIGAAIDLCLGERVDLSSVGLRDSVVPTGSRIFGSPVDGILRGVRARAHVLKEYGSSVHELVYDLNEGARVRRFTQGNRRLGHVVASAGDPDRLESLLDEIESAVDFQIS